MNDKSLKDWSKVINKRLKTFPHDFLVFFVMGGWLIFFLFLADLGTKLGMQAYFGGDKNSSIINLITYGGDKTLLGVTLRYNEGFAYGWGEGYRPLMATISGVVGLGLIGYLAYRFQEKPWYLRYALYFLIAGDLGNFIDRTFYLSYPNGVIDWIAIGNDDWPMFFHFVCNFADIWLSVGVIMLIISIIAMLVVEQRAERIPAKKTNQTKAGSKAGDTSAAELAKLKKDLETKKGSKKRVDE